MTQVGDEPYLAARRLGPCADIDDYEAIPHRDRQGYRRPRLSQRSGKRPFVRAHRIEAPIDDELRSVDARAVQVLRIDVLPLNRLSQRKAVPPAEVIPVIHVEGERHDIGPRAQLSEVGLRGRTGAAALRSEE